MIEWKKSNHPWIGKDIFSETVQHVFPKENEIIEEWGGSMRCMTSDGRNVNMAEELNKLEREENDYDTTKDKKTSKTP